MEIIVQKIVDGQIGRSSKIIEEITVTLSLMEKYIL